MAVRLDLSPVPTSDTLYAVEGKLLLGRWPLEADLDGEARRYGGDVWEWARHLYGTCYQGDGI